MSDQPFSPPAFSDQGICDGGGSHDHELCVRQALDAAEVACLQQGVKLTALRRRVLELVWQSRRPVGAYTLLDALKGDGQSAQPPTVYRALDFLMAHGFVHKLESLNAFLGCSHPGAPHAGQFLICRDCGRTEELEDTTIAETIVASAARHGFSVLRQSVEIEGRCSDCQQALV